MEMPFAGWVEWARETIIIWGPDTLRGMSNFWGLSVPLKNIGSLLCGVSENSWTDRDGVWGADSCGPKEPFVRGVKVGRIHLPQGVTRRRCGLSIRISWLLVVARWLYAYSHCRVPVTSAADVAEIPSLSNVRRQGDGEHVHRGAQVHYQSSDGKPRERSGGKGRQWRLEKQV